MITEGKGRATCFVTNLQLSSKSKIKRDIQLGLTPKHHLTSKPTSTKHRSHRSRKPQSSTLSTTAIPPGQEQHERKHHRHLKKRLTRLHDNIQRLYKERSVITNRNKESYQFLTSVKQARRSLDTEVRRLENTIKAVEVQQSKKMGQFNVLNKKLLKAERLRRVRDMDSILRRRIKKNESMMLRNAKEEVSKAKRELRKSLMEARERNRLLKKFQKNRVEQKLTQKKVENRYKMMRRDRHRKNMRMKSKLFQRTTKLSKQKLFMKKQFLKNFEYVKEFVSNRKAIRGTMRSMEAKSRKYAKIVKNIFEAQGLVDKCNSIYESIQDASCTESENETAWLAATGISRKKRSLAGRRLWRLVRRSKSKEELPRLRGEDDLGFKSAGFRGVRVPRSRANYLSFGSLGGSGSAERRGRLAGGSLGRLGRRGAGPLTDPARGYVGIEEVGYGQR